MRSPLAVVSCCYLFVDDHTVTFSVYVKLSYHSLLNHGTQVVLMTETHRCGILVQYVIMVSAVRPPIKLCLATPDL